MTAKQYLQQIQKLDWLIEQKTDELNKMRDTVTGIRGIDYSADRAQHCANSNGMETVERMVDDTRKLQNDIASLVGRRNKIVRQIQKQKNKTFSELLYKRYVKGENLNQIAEEMQYSYGHVRRMHGQALEEFKGKWRRDNNEN